VLVAGRIRELFSRVETFGDVTHHPSETPRAPASSRHSDSPSAHGGSMDAGANPSPLQNSRLVVDMSPVRSVDGAAVQVFLEIMQDFRSKHMNVFLVGVRTEIYTMFVNAGLPKLLGPDRFTHSLVDALAPLPEYSYPVPVPPPQDVAIASS
jgi:hypothetical protein